MKKEGLISLVIYAVLAIIVGIAVYQQWTSSKRKRRTYILKTLLASGKRGTTATGLIYSSDGLVTESALFKDLRAMNKRGLVMNVSKVRPGRRRPINLYFLTDAGEAAAQKLH